MTEDDFNSDEVESTHNFSEGLVEGHDSGLDARDLEAIEALPAGHALLIITRGYEEGSRFLIDTDVTLVGRHPKADIFLDDVTVSRRHAEFVRTENHFKVRDLASLNGTYYNGRRVDEVLLEDGAEVQIGKFKLSFFASKAGR
jgi:pSer/pThr/pTyr-binding forkhead associated (FHA) protein